MRDNGYRAVGEAAAIFALALSTRWLYVHQTGDHPLRDIPIGAPSPMSSERLEKRPISRRCTTPFSGVP